MMLSWSKAHLLPTATGLAMAAAAGIDTSTAAAIAALLSALAVGAGIGLRVAATLAVLLAAAAVLLGDAPPVQAGLVGLVGASYLLLRHTARELVRRSAIVAAVCFTGVAMVITSLPLDLPWLPTLAAPAMFVAYLLAVGPFLPNGAGLRSNRDGI